MSEKIQTPVDDFVDLVFVRKKITASEAALELKLPLSQIEEWAQVLEKHNIMSIEYRVDGMTFVANSLTPEEYSKKILSFVARKKEAEKRLTIIERTLSMPCFERAELVRKAKELDSKADSIIRNYMYFNNVISRRRKSPEVAEKEKQNYENAMIVNQKLEELADEMKKIERECNLITALHTKLKTEVVLLDKQTEDIEKIDHGNFISLLNSIEKRISELESKRNSYLKIVESIQEKMSKLSEKIPK